jgi:hypothetical protein
MLRLITTIGFLCLALAAHAGDADPAAQLPKLRNWLLKHRDPATGLPYSHVGDQRFEKWCITYDAAVTAMAFIALGDVGEAQKIIDFYRESHEPRRLGGFIEAMRVTSPPTGVEWSVRTGANVWLGIASFQLFRETGDPKYFDFASQIADFALRLQEKDPNNPAFGGVRLGPAGDPNFEGDQHLGHDSAQPVFERIFSTEVAIDSYTLFGMLSEVNRFREGRDRARTWLEKVALNRVQSRWNRGFFQSADPAIATDVHAWGISAFGVDGLDAFAPGLAEKMAAFVEDKCRATVEWTRPGGGKVKVTGFDFTDRATAQALRRSQMVSPEWSFEMANAYQRLADDFAERGEDGKSDLYGKKREELIGSLMQLAVVQGDAAGFPYATLAESPVGHEYRTPSQGNLSTIGVAYAILAIKKFDPLKAEAR